MNSRIDALRAFFLLSRYTSCVKKLLLTAVRGFGIYLYILTPANERACESFLTRTPDALVSSSSVTLVNVRNWNHRTASVLAEDWIDTVKIKPADIEKIWFGLDNSQMSNPEAYLSFFRLNL
jgi:hypothetical protein